MMIDFQIVAVSAATNLLVIGGIVFGLLCVGHYRNYSASNLSHTGSVGEDQNQNQEEEEEEEDLDVFPSDEFSDYSVSSSLNSKDDEGDTH